MSVNDFLMDFAIASLFIMIGQLIRAKVKLVQKFFVPASMIADFWPWRWGARGLMSCRSPRGSAPTRAR